VSRLVRKSPSVSKTRQTRSLGLDDVNNVDLVILATYRIGGVLRTVDTEDIAMKAQELAPGRFSWRKYPQQVDIERVRVRLSQAKHEGMLSGVHSVGWRLTADGAKHVQDALLKLSRRRPTKVSVTKADRQWLAAERKRLLTTTAYKKHAAGESAAITRVDIQEFFRIDEYMEAAKRKTKRDRLVTAFRGDKTLGNLAANLAAKSERG
jgi:hypothetical protein